MQRIILKTSRKREVLDITDVVEDQLGNSGNESGVCHLLVLHTTAALTLLILIPAPISTCSTRSKQWSQSCATVIHTTPGMLPTTFCPL